MLYADLDPRGKFDSTFLVSSIFIALCASELMLLSFGLEHRVAEFTFQHAVMKANCKHEEAETAAVGAAAIQRQTAEYAEQAPFDAAHQVASHSACRDEGQRQARGSRKLPRGARQVFDVKPPSTPRLDAAHQVASHSACRDEGQLQAQRSRKLPRKELQGSDVKPPSTPSMLGWTSAPSY